MRLEGLKSIVNKKYRVCTTDSKHAFPVADNVLNREFDVYQPGKVWVSDITYIKVKQSWLYLTVVLDLFDRKVIGWAMSNGMTAEQTTLPALSMAIGNRPFNKGLIFHSDRGVQYACNHTKYEQKGKLLGQRCDGKLLQESQIRDYLWWL